MADVIDIDLVKWLIFDKKDISSVAIAKKTSLSEQAVGQYRNGKLDLEKASLKNIRSLEKVALTLKGRDYEASKVRDSKNYKVKTIDHDIKKWEKN